MFTLALKPRGGKAARDARARRAPLAQRRRFGRKEDEAAGEAAPMPAALSVADAVAEIDRIAVAAQAIVDEQSGAADEAAADVEALTALKTELAGMIVAPAEGEDPAQASQGMLDLMAWIDAAVADLVIVAEIAPDAAPAEPAGDVAPSEAASRRRRAARMRRKNGGRRKGLGRRSGGISGTANDYQSAVDGATSLDDLASILNEVEEYVADDGGQIEDYVSIESLPIFGGVEPNDTSGIYSWDEDSFLIYDGSWLIVPRPDAEY